MTNQAVEHTSYISIGYVKGMEVNNAYKISWGNGNKISIVKHSSHIVLMYVLDDSDIRVHVDITQTKVGYGMRDWFNCPVCKDRASKLYNILGIFACRDCHNLVYLSSKASRNDLDYIGLKIQKLKNKLELTGNDYLEPVIFKPKNMHQTTFDLLKMQLGIRQIHFTQAWLNQL